MSILSFNTVKYTLWGFFFIFFSVKIDKKDVKIKSPHDWLAVHIEKKVK